MAQWRMFPTDDMTGAWGDVFGTAIIRQVADGQQAAATLTTPFVESILDYADFEGLPGSTDPKLYRNVTRGGQELGPLLYGGVTESKTALARGYSLADSMAQGGAFLLGALKTAMSDAARMSDMSLTAGRGVPHYTRVIAPGSCARCAVLAGIASSAVAFPRHPNCKCMAVPTPGGDPRKFKFPASGEEYFDSLSIQEQNKIFTKAGAKAIRDGADLNQVVNARRGARGIQYSTHDYLPAVERRRLTPVRIGTKPNGEPLLAYVTSEGTSRRGAYGRQEARRQRDAEAQGSYYRTTKLRLMPEQIYRMAGDNPERVRELLIRYGYIFV